NDGNDQFTLNITEDIGGGAAFPVQSVQIQGNNGPGGAPSDSENRDRVTVNDDNPGGRVLNYQYLATQGDLDIEAGASGLGLFGGNGDFPLQIRSTETLVFNDTSG